MFLRFFRVLIIRKILRFHQRTAGNTETFLKNRRERNTELYLIYTAYQIVQSYNFFRRKYEYISVSVNLINLATSYRRILICNFIRCILIKEKKFFYMITGLISVSSIFSKKHIGY